MRMRPPDSSLILTSRTCTIRLCHRKHVTGAIVVQTLDSGLVTGVRSFRFGVLHLLHSLHEKEDAASKGTGEDAVDVSLLSCQ
jgi:hypothetical protein